MRLVTFTSLDATQAAVGLGHFRDSPVFKVDHQFLDNIVAGINGRGIRDISFR